MDKTEFIAHIRGFTNFTDPLVQTDAKIMGWVFMAETHISESLRIADMVQIDTATLTNGRVATPPDFIAADFVRDLETGLPRHYSSRDEFYAGTVDVSNRYTQSGNYLMFGGTISSLDTAQIELHYFGDVPHLTNAATWLSSRFNALLTVATLSVAFAAMEQMDQATSYEASLISQISGLNDRYRTSVGSGSKLNRRARRVFG